MNLGLILVPYDSGRRDWRTGRGPEHLLRVGLADRLRVCGHQLAIETMTDDPTLPAAEVRTALELMRRIAEKVRACRAAGPIPAGR